MAFDGRSTLEAVDILSRESGYRNNTQTDLYLRIILC